MLRRALILALTLVLGGCIERVATQEAYIGDHQFRRTPRGIEFKSAITANQTSSEEIRSFLGKPLWHFRDGHTDVYQAEAGHHWVLNLLPVVIAHPPNAYLVRFDYDDSGVLRHVEAVPGFVPENSRPSDLTWFWTDLKKRELQGAVQ